jgi:hypothetical protein
MRTAVDVYGDLAAALRNSNGGYPQRSSATLCTPSSREKRHAGVVGIIASGQRRPEPHLIRVELVEAVNEGSMHADSST